MMGVSSCDRADRLTDDDLVLVNLPLSLSRWGRFVSLSWRAVVLARLARRNRADVAIIDSGSAQFFFLFAFRLVGIPVAVNFHNVLWPTGFAPHQLKRRMMLALSGLFFRFGAVAVLGCAREIQRQVARIGGAKLPFFLWQAQFSMAALMPAARPAHPPHILFVGQIDRSKGVFDLIAISDLLVKEHGIEPIFDICGHGSAMAEMKAAAATRPGQFVFHGWLGRAELVARYQAAHVVIVPSRIDIGEGMPQVCAEAALLGIPLVTSTLSNAGDFLGDAMIEVPPEDLSAYARAIAAILKDERVAARLSQAGPVCAAGFQDRRLSYPAAVDAMLCRIFPARVSPMVDFDPMFERVM